MRPPDEDRALSKWSHIRGADGRCQACGEPFPCPSVMAHSHYATLLAEASAEQAYHEVAEHVGGKLVEQLDTLRWLEAELEGHPVQDIRKRVHLHKVSAAIDHLQQAIDDLEFAISK